jgi:hypothetical protein
MHSDRTSQRLIPDDVVSIQAYIQAWDATWRLTYTTGITNVPKSVTLTTEAVANVPW